MGSCLFLVDDPSGDCIPVDVYHFVANPSLFGPSLDSQLPIGAKIAIREPYVTIASGGGLPFVGVDSPTDIVILEDDEPCCKGVAWRYDGDLRRVQSNKSAEDYKALGNIAFQRKDYYSALAAFEHALKAPGAQKIHAALYSNTSATCLHLSKPGRAYLSAKAALATNPAEPHLVAKAFFRQASAAYQLRCFNEAKLLFGRGLAVAKNDAKAQGLVKEFNECLAKTSQRQQERDTGAYDFQTMFSNVVAGGPNARIDVADFIGPVEIRSSPSSSRGLYVTRDIAAGELLLVNKAISVANRKDPETENVTLFALNLARNVTATETQVLNTTRLVHSCIDNPAMYPIVCHLFDGNPPSSPSMPPLRMVDSEKEVLKQLGVTVNVDAGRLERIFPYNAFGDPCISSSIGSAEAGTYLKENNSASQFYTISFCNHSCVPNTLRAVFGDVMVIRALSPLSKGDEITVRYVPYDMSIEQRQQILERYFGFHCDCWFCREEMMDREEDRKRRKEAIDIELPKAMVLVRQAIARSRDGNYDAALSSAAFKAVECIKGTVEATYHPERGLFRPEMCQIWSPLADMNRGVKVRKSIEVLSSLIEMHGLVAHGAVIINTALIKKHKGSNSKSTVMLSQPPLWLTDNVVHAFLLLAAMHFMLGELDLQRNWVTTAIWAHDVLIGGGLPVLKKRGPEDLKRLL